MSEVPQGSIYLGDSVYAKIEDAQEAAGFGP